MRNAIYDNEARNAFIETIARMTPTAIEANDDEFGSSVAALNRLIEMAHQLPPPKLPTVAIVLDDGGVKSILCDQQLEHVIVIDYAFAYSNVDEAIEIEQPGGGRALAHVSYPAVELPAIDLSKL